jgi:hypothetical protein
MMVDSQVVPKPVSKTCMRQTFKFKLKSQAQDKTEMKR